MRTHGVQPRKQAVHARHLLPVYEEGFSQVGQKPPNVTASTEAGEVHFHRGSGQGLDENYSHASGPRCGLVRGSSGFGSGGSGGVLRYATCKSLRVSTGTSRRSSRGLSTSRRRATTRKLNSTGAADPSLCGRAHGRALTSKLSL